MSPEEVKRMERPEYEAFVRYQDRYIRSIERAQRRGR